MDWEALSSTLATDLLFMSMTIHPVLCHRTWGLWQWESYFCHPSQGTQITASVHGEFQILQRAAVTICSEGLGEKGRGSLVQVHVTLRAASVVWRIS